MRTNFFNSGTQTRWLCKFGAKIRGTILVTCRPTPPFFLARPRRWMTLPRTALEPVILQILDIILTLPKERLKCRAPSRRSSECYYFDSVHKDAIFQCREDTDLTRRTGDR